MGYLIIYGIIVILALCLYVLILKASAELLLQRQINKDILYIDFKSSNDFMSNNFNVEKTDFVNLDKVELFTTSSWTHMFLGNNRYFGSQISILIENWLFNVSLNRNFSFNIEIDSKFRRKKFKFKECATILKCIKCIKQSKVKSVDLFLKYTAEKIKIKCLFNEEVDFFKALNALDDSLKIKSIKSLKILSGEKNELTLLIDL